MNKLTKNRWALPLAYFSLALIPVIFYIRSIHPSTHVRASNKQAATVALMIIFMACVNITAGAHAYKAWTLSSSEFAIWSRVNMLSEHAQLWSARIFAPIGFVLTLLGLIWVIALILTGWISFQAAW